MSGVGKSYWSKKFKEIGFDIYPIDDLISNKVSSLIKATVGDKNVKYENTKVGDLAKWMGFPGDKRYKNNAKKYLQLESQITLESAKLAVKNGRSAIIDTTGSVIYTNKKVQDFLRRNTKIIYFDTTEKNLDKMFAVFCAVPKPIIWGDIYKPIKNEDESRTLARCYKELLDSRIKKYKKLAHKKVDYLFAHKKNLNVKDLEKKIITN